MKRRAIEIDASRAEIKIDGKPVHFLPKERDIMTLLFHSDGIVLSRELIAEKIWGEENIDSLRTIDQYVARIRKRLGRHHRAIMTVVPLGYRYIGA